MVRIKTWYQVILLTWLWLNFPNNMADVEPLISTPGCTIPDFKITDPLINKYIFRERPVVCNKHLPQLYSANQTAIYLVEDAMEDYEILDPRALSCCYQYFWRAPPIANQSDKPVIYDETCHLVASSAKVDPDEEFLRIRCHYFSKEIYRDFFSFVPLKPARQGITQKTNGSKLNVLLIGIDCVSRLNFHRQMPKTAVYLKSLNAYEFLGYNQVNYGTFANLMPVLTGHSPEEMREGCWPSRQSYFDDCPFIWKDYKQAGYSTALVEDCSWMSLFYFAEKLGFRQKPTDYYYNNFDWTATLEIGNNHRSTLHQCIGSRQTHQVILDYVNNFAITMQRAAQAVKPYFGFFWTTSLSHDYFNKPKLGDHEYTNQLDNLHQAGVFNNTILIVMSDHGMRYSAIRKTYQGRLEEHLPFLFMVLPQWYRDAHPNIDRNLKINTKRLTTPFDLHETFLDILNPDRELNTTATQTLPRGLSLFREIPGIRTCAMAGIAQHWCTCEKSVVIATTSAVVVQVAKYTVKYINELLSDYKDCVKLRLHSIEDANEFRKDNVTKETKEFRVFRVMFRTLPGGALFEATVTREDDEKSKTPRYLVSGAVSRINMYGDQSKCINNFQLKLYCYCR